MAVTAIRLPEIMDSRAARPFAARLVELEGESIVLDASAVRRVGGLCLQVILATQRGRLSADVTFELSEPSVAFCEAMTLLGAQALVQKDRV